MKDLVGNRDSWFCHEKAQIRKVTIPFGISHLDPIHAGRHMQDPDTGSQAPPLSQSH